MMELTAERMLGESDHDSVQVHLVYIDNANEAIQLCQEEKEEPEVVAFSRKEQSFNLQARTLDSELEEARFTIRKLKDEMRELTKAKGAIQDD
jgi:hypothetical protein